MVKNMIKKNVEKVEKNIQAALQKADRGEKEAILIAVSKTKPIVLLQEAYEAGIRDFGENKVQELVDKYEKMRNQEIRWHFIGHLQTNKVKYIIDKAYMIHSVDSYKLACEISKESLKHKKLVPILVQVNVSMEESKFGVHPEEAEEFIRKIAKLPGIAVQGLMTIAPYTENGESNRYYFRKLNQLSVDIKRKNIDNINMGILSMGMTGDYETAIEEGATYVRVGTGIFGIRDYSERK